MKTSDIVLLIAVSICIFIAWNAITKNDIQHPKGKIEIVGKSCIMEKQGNGWLEWVECASDAWVLSKDNDGICDGIIDEPQAIVEKFR